MADDYRFDGLTSRELAEMLGLPRVELMETTASTMDVAHRLASGNEPEIQKILDEYGVPRVSQ